MTFVRALRLGWLLMLVSTSVHAQQPFSFVVTDPGRGATESHPEPLTAFAGQRLDPLFGVESSIGRFTLLALEDSRFVRRDPRQARQAEFLVGVLKPSAPFHLAIGGGIRHESGGVDVLLTRVVLERPSGGGRLVGNVTFERPLSGDRDAMDVITTVGWNRRVTEGLHLGFEALAEDLEGLWTPNEAEGGARLFIGPALAYELPAHTWTLHLTTGGEVAAGHPARANDATRALGRTGFLMRVSMTRVF
jgi:hypothetical protein